MVSMPSGAQAGDGPEGHQEAETTQSSRMDGGGGSEDAESFPVVTEGSGDSVAGVQVELFNPSP